jgi:hypothetical protein
MPSQPTQIRNHVVRRQELVDRLDLIDQPIEDRVDLYRSLNELLSTGENDRFVLYCPLELVPSIDDYRKHEDIDTFYELYVQALYRLFHEQDVRASFVDGDVPDIELGVQSIPMIIQAAYLIPALEQKGLVSKEQMPDWYDFPLFHQSLAQATQPSPITPPAQWQPRKIREALQEKEYEHTSEKRAKWLNWEHRRKTIKALAESLGTALCQGELIPEVWEPKSDFAEIVIHGIANFIEQRPGQFDQHHHRILELRDDQDITGIFCRFNHLGIISDEILAHLDIKKPALEGPIHQNIEDLPERPILNQILQKSELVDAIHPVVIVYGSRLKGYGGPTSDLDLAVFVRHEISEVSYIERSIHKHFGQKVTQFWLNKDGTIKDNDKLSPFAGSSLRAHVLLNGAWEGDPKEIKRLQKPIRQFYAKEKNPDVRKIWLREMERDLLQYRLLHRGYEAYRVVPRGTSTFLDPGYRLTAAKLYAGYVELP